VTSRNELLITCKFLINESIVAFTERIMKKSYINLTSVKVSTNWENPNLPVVVILFYVHSSLIGLILCTLFYKNNPGSGEEESLKFSISGAVNAVKKIAASATQLNFILLHALSRKAEALSRASTNKNFI